MALRIVVDVYVVLVGLVVGSYLNVLIHRLPRRISTVLPRSRCPRCRTAIRPWDNVPVVSFLVLGGRCRACGVSIPWRYPFVEALTGLCFWLGFRTFEPVAPIVVGLGLAAVLIALAMIDLEHYLLPDVLTLTGLTIGLTLVPLTSWTSYAEAWLGAAVGGGLLLAVTWGWYWWKGVHGMGFGDVKMLALIGGFLGWPGVVATLLVATLAGTAYGLVQVVRGRMGLRSKLPFGVFLAVGALWTLFHRADLWVLWQDWSRIVMALLIRLERWSSP